MHTESDHELALKAKAGDESAFNELMRRHYKGILNFIIFDYNKCYMKTLRADVRLVKDAQKRLLLTYDVFVNNKKKYSIMFKL